MESQVFSPALLNRVDSIAQISTSLSRPKARLADVCALGASEEMVVTSSQGRRYSKRPQEVFKATSNLIENFSKSL
jgi:hypothetical protein